MPPTPLACPIFKIPLLKGSPGCVLVIGLSVCIALYIYFMYRELQMMGARVELSCREMINLHTGTNDRMDELQKRVDQLEGMGQCNMAQSFMQHATANNGTAPQFGIPGLPMPMPMFMDAMCGVPNAQYGGGSMTAVIEVENEQDCDADSVDSDEIKQMLIAQDVDDDDSADVTPTDVQSPPPKLCDEDQSNTSVHVDDGGACAPDTEDLVACVDARGAVGVEGAQGAVGVEGAQGAAKLSPSLPDLRTMKVDELRQLLRTRGMDWRGTKEVLIERLESGSQ